jgi:putative GTP pyrophosphokinase
MKNDKFSNIDIENFFTKEQIGDLFIEYAKINKNYQSAIKEITTKLEVLDDDFQLLHKHNPIHSIGSRVKSPESIAEKIIRKGLPLDFNHLSRQLLDIAGVRVICNYIADIYLISELLKGQPDIRTIREVDYIKTPKENGYRSLHLVISVPVFFVDRTEEIPVEVQIRTIAMDFWASLEHQIRYKSKGEIPNFIASELKDCAETIAETDIRMEKIHSFLDSLEF